MYFIFDEILYGVLDCILDLIWGFYVGFEFGLYAVFYFVILKCILNLFEMQFYFHCWLYIYILHVNLDFISDLTLVFYFIYYCVFKIAIYLWLHFGSFISLFWKCNLEFLLYSILKVVMSSLFYLCLFCFVNFVLACILFLPVIMNLCVAVVVGFILYLCFWFMLYCIVLFVMLFVILFWIVFCLLVILFSMFDVFYLGLYVGMLFWMVFGIWFCMYGGLHLVLRIYFVWY